MDARDTWMRFIHGTTEENTLQYSLEVIKAGTVPDDCYWCRHYACRRSGLNASFVCELDKSRISCRVEDFTRYVLENT